MMTIYSIMVKMHMVAPVTEYCSKATQTRKAYVMEKTNGKHSHLNSFKSLTQFEINLNQLVHINSTSHYPYVPAMEHML